MIYRVEPTVFAVRPDFVRAVVVAYDLDNTARDVAELHQALRERLQTVRADSAIALDHPRLAAWSSAYRQAAISEGKRLAPSVAALVRRAKKRGPDAIPFISPIVCISNLVSLMHLVPSGVIDASALRGDLVLGPAAGSEWYAPIGTEHTTRLQHGEIAYVDRGTNQVLCAGWNSRGGKAAWIDPRTTRAILDVDGLTEVVTENEIWEAASKAAALLKTHCGAQATVHVLDRNHPAFEVPRDAASPQHP